jgi:hypothetical protein
MPRLRVPGRVFVCLANQAAEQAPRAGEIVYASDVLRALDRDANE